MITCPRCGTKTNTSICSRFNTEQICLPCKEAEKKHPLYKLASKAEHHQLTLGNFNYEGIGCPASLYKKDTDHNVNKPESYKK